MVASGAWQLVLRKLRAVKGTLEGTEMANPSKGSILLREAVMAVERLGSGFVRASGR